MTDAPPHLLVEESEGILVVTLNRPEKLNALSLQTMQGIEAAVVRLRDTDALKVMLLRATGRYFSAGVDLKEENDRRGETARGLREDLRLRTKGMQRIYDEMEHIEKPIVAAHHAPCVGGGLEMSLSCDFRLAAESATYGLPEAGLGVLPASNGVSRLTRICGPHWARYLIMANKTVTAQQALNMGLVHEVHPDASFEQAVMDFCRHLAKQNGEVLGAAKIAIELASELGRDSARQVERLANCGLSLNPGFAQGWQNYVDRVGGKE